MMDIDFSQARIKMVDGQVRTTDVTDLALISAMLEVPREEFVPAERRALAYIDEDIAIAPGRYLMEASPLAKLLQLAAIAPGDIVLDIGCGTGYSAARSVATGQVRSSRWRAIPTLPPDGSGERLTCAGLRQCRRCPRASCRTGATPTRRPMT
jgi:SAM-dependent methyltransferase